MGLCRKKNERVKTTMETAMLYFAGFLIAAFGAVFSGYVRHVFMERMESLPSPQQLKLLVIAATAFLVMLAAAVAAGIHWQSSWVMQWASTLFLIYLMTVHLATDFVRRESVTSTGTFDTVLKQLLSACFAFSVAYVSFGMMITQDPWALGLGIGFGFIAGLLSAKQVNDFLMECETAVAMRFPYVIMGILAIVVTVDLCLPWQVHILLKALVLIVTVACCYVLETQVEIRELFTGFFNGGIKPLSQFCRYWVEFGIRRAADGVLIIKEGTGATVLAPPEGVSPTSGPLTPSVDGGPSTSPTDS